MSKKEKTKLDITTEMLRTSESAEEVKMGIRESLNLHLLNINMSLHTNDHWIKQVRDSKAHDPSMFIQRNVVRIQGNKIFATGQHKITEHEAIEQLKQTDQWEGHVEECEIRFEESQNWTRLMSLVQIYESWEGDYRHVLLGCVNLEDEAISGKMTKPKLCHPRFGDLRHIRNKFLHNRGVFADDEPDDIFESMTGLFEKGEKMILTADHHNAIRQAVVEEIDLFPEYYFLLGEKI